MISILGRWPVLVIVGIVIGGVAFELLPIAIVRAGAMLALLAQIFQERRAGGNLFLTSPLFLLGASALFFYSFVLGVFDTAYPGLPFDSIESFYGSDAERMFVIFGLCCVAGHSLIAESASGHAETNQNRPGSAGLSIPVFVGIAMTVSLANTVNYVSLESGGPHIAEIRSLAAPLLAFCLVYLVYLSVEASGRQKLLIAVAMLLVLGSLFYMHEGKKPFFMIIAGLLYWLRLKNVSMKALILAGVAFVLFAGIVVQAVQVIRVPETSLLNTGDQSGASMVGTVLRAKVVLRQIETRYCLQNVIDKHWRQPFSVSKQLFWLKGLVPRVLWPEKPNLSLGRYYAREYCIEKEGSKHTTSISLLGQPIIYGGWGGLLLHGGILITCLGGITWLGRNPARLSAATTAALLPWLIDFDQHFALYVANAVKFFIVMSPLIFLAARTRISR